MKNETLITVSVHYVCVRDKPHGKIAFVRRRRVQNLSNVMNFNYGT